MFKFRNVSVQYLREIMHTKMCLNWSNDWHLDAIHKKFISGYVLVTTSARTTKGLNCCRSKCHGIQSHGFQCQWKMETIICVRELLWHFQSQIFVPDRGFWFLWHLSLGQRLVQTNLLLFCIEFRSGLSVAALIITLVNYWYSRQFSICVYISIYI